MSSSIHTYPSVSECFPRYEQDLKTLGEHSISLKELAERLDKLVKTALKGWKQDSKKSLDQFVDFGSRKYAIKVSAFNVVHLCEACPETLPRLKKFEVKNLSNEETVTFTDFLVHTLTQHNAFPCRGLFGRVEPLQLAHVLGFGVDKA